MTATSLLISIAVVAWVAQIALGWWQINRFNRALDDLCQLGRVGIGRSGGFLKPRVVLALAFDVEQRISGAFMMRGLTVFARPRPINHLCGLHLEEIVPDVIFPQDTASQTALTLAIEPKS